MNTFSIEAFAAGCKKTMAESQNPKLAARAYLADSVERCGPAEIIRALQAAVPPGASIGELIVHASPELTMLYGRMPARFQSGIHDHTVCAVIGQLQGEEVNRFYQADEGGTLREVGSTTVRVGDVLVLNKDVIHSIENPGTAPAHALHLYRGDFGALGPRRSLWSWNEHEQRPFSFPHLLEESATAMYQSGNRAGLDALVEAMPAARAFVARLTEASA